MMSLPIRVGWVVLQQTGAYADADSAPEPAAGQRDPRGSEQHLSELRKASLSELLFLEGPLWSRKPPEAMLVSVAHAFAPDYDETRDHVDV